MLDICICTHNPHPALFSRVLSAIAGQDATAAFGVLVVDNCSSPAVTDAALQPLRERQIPARIVREEKPGLVHARLRAIAETRAPWVLCVDDDNVLAPDYVAAGLTFIAEHPDVAAFGGKLVLPDDVRPPAWSEPFLPFLAVRDLGDDVLKGVAEAWRIWEPPAAGAFIAREVLEDFAAFVRTNPDAATLGRAPGSMASCEDSLLMHSAYKLKRATAYNPRLKLEHHVSSSRFQLANLVRLMEGFGRSQAVLDRVLHGGSATPLIYRTPIHVAGVAAVAALRNLKTPAYAFARARFHMAAAEAYWRSAKAAA